MRAHTLNTVGQSAGSENESYRRSLYEPAILDHGTSCYRTRSSSTSSEKIWNRTYPDLNLG